MIHYTPEAYKSLSARSPAHAIAATMRAAGSRVIVEIIRKG